MSRKLLHELRQSQPFASVQEEATLEILRTADHLRRLLTRELESHGLSLQQYNILRILRGAGEGGMPTLEVAARMVEEAPGITRLMDRLEAKMLVRRERCLADRRQVLCWITAEGRELAATLEHPVDGALHSAFRNLTARHLGTLIESLEKIRNS